VAWAVSAVGSEETHRREADAERTGSDGSAWSGAIATHLATVVHGLGSAEDLVAFGARELGHDLAVDRRRDIRVDDDVEVVNVAFRGSAKEARAGRTLGEVGHGERIGEHLVDQRRY